MAIVIRGLTNCSLCSQSLREADDIVSFPLFVVNPSDSLAFLNDAAFHLSCFKKHPLAEMATINFKRFEEANMPKNRICAVCNSIVDNPDEHLGLGHLSSEPNHPLYAFNNLHFHRTCIIQWQSLKPLIQELEQCRRSGEWTGKSIDWILSLLNKRPVK